MRKEPLTAGGSERPDRKGAAFADLQTNIAEKDILLSLHNSTTTVREKKDILDLIIVNIKLLFDIEDIFICSLNSHPKTITPILRAGSPGRSKIQDYDRIMDSGFPMHDRCIDAILKSAEPLVFDLKKINHSPAPPEYMKLAAASGLAETLSMSLHHGGETIGILMLWSEKRGHFTPRHQQLMSAIVTPISLVVANILAHEKVTRREEEKIILLSLSTEIASLSNRDDLCRVINARVKEIFSITHFGIGKIDDDRLTHSAFVMDLGETITQQIDQLPPDRLKYSIKDKAFSTVMTSDDPVILDVDQLANEPNPPEYVAIWQQAGFRKLLCLALRVGGKPIGAIFFNIRPAALDNVKMDLLKGICAQLSVAVSNILANEKVLHQLLEIDKYKRQLEEEKIYLQEEIKTSQNHTEIIGESPEIKKVFRMVTQVAYSDSTVLILGETGTGKELIARAIHNNSTRRSKLMVKVNCAALPSNLIESELFGHERGSFTGAHERRIGKFELANHGTLFLDEIGEMPLDLQVKLLRALQEKEIERVGGTATIKTDVRIIAATNRDLERLMEEGKFRSDLYYRLNIFPIPLPPLRNRREDIPQLTSYFIVRHANKAGKKIKTIHNKVLQELMQYNWPGNIRELEHLIERSVLLATGDTIEEIHLPHQKRNSPAAVPAKEHFTITTIDEHEKEYILKVLRFVHGRIGGAGGAAELLGIPPSTLNSRMKRLGIRKEHFG